MKKLLLTLTLGFSLLFCHSAKAGGAALTITMGPEFNQLIARNLAAVNHTVITQTNVADDYKNVQEISVDEIITNPGAPSSSAEKPHHNQNKLQSTAVQKPRDPNENYSVAHQDIERKNAGRFENSFMEPGSKIYPFGMRIKNRFQISGFLSDHAALTLPQKFRNPSLRLNRTHCDKHPDLK